MFGRVHLKLLRQFGGLMALVLACFAPIPMGRAAAQPSPVQNSAAVSDAQPPPDAPASPDPSGSPEAPESAGGGEIVIDLETFGVGNTIRPGDWAGIRLALTDRAEKPRDVAIQLHLPDSDGDTALLTRIIALSPGRRSGVWLYLPVPWQTLPGSVFQVSISAVSSGDDGPRIGRQIAWKRIQAQQVVAEKDGLTAVIGASALGLDQYGQAYKDRDWAPGAHELVHAVQGLTPEGLPDSWLGWAPFETVLWNEGDPSQMQGEGPAAALREWVHRGGHLVIVLPAVGQVWSSSTNPLASLMPSARIERITDIDLNPYRVLLTGDPKRQLPAKASLHRFVIDDGTEAREATPLLTGTHGCIAARRLVGTGMVTVVGLDLGSRALQRSASLRGDAFWARLLGKRASTLSVAEMEKYSQNAAFGRSAATGAWIDDHLAETISKGRAAGTGILLGLLVFLVYWLVAGPVGFWFLKRRGQERHAWVGFLAAAAVFTVVAWLGAAALRPKLEQAWHYTVLDHVYGQQVQRARSFVSVLLPSYGEQTVTLGDAGEEDPWRQALMPWADPSTRGRLAFPDARPYAVDARRTTRLTVPARSTIKTFQADWLGGPRLSMPIPASESERPRIDTASRLSGALVHSLPGPLVNARVIFVRRQIPETASIVDPDKFVPKPPIADAYAWSLDSWEPGQRLDLARFIPDDSSKIEALLSKLVPMVSIIDGALPISTRRADLEDMAAFFSLLAQPDPTRSTLGEARSPAILHRRILPTWDLAEWFTQPCLIIVGRIEEQPCPVPLFVDGQALDGKSRPSSGRTVVRWIYPLSPAPVSFGARIQQLSKPEDADIPLRPFAPGTQR